MNGNDLSSLSTTPAAPEPSASDQFLNLRHGVVGRTVSTKSEPNTSSTFLFWIADRDRVAAPEDEGPDLYEGGLEIGNIVAARSDDSTDVTFGMVTEMRSYSDVDSFIADYISHNFGDAQIEVPTDVAEVIVVTCATMRNTSGRTKPLGRSHVFFPSPLGIQFAFGIADAQGDIVYSGSAIPIGVFQNGDGTVAAVSVDEDFMVGPEGAHLNVSGISGLASKTSASEFIITSLLSCTSKRVGVVMFNVKSKDLLYVDQPNPRLQNDPWSLEVYDALGITPLPFENARFFAPADPEDPQGHQSRRVLATERFTWELDQIKGSIPSLFNKEDWDDKMDGLWIRIYQQITSGGLHTYARMLSWIDNQIANATQSNNQWPQGHHIATWHKMRSRLGRFPLSYKGLIQTAGAGEDIPWDDLSHKGVFVIDIEMLGDAGKRFVFSRSISRIAHALERGSNHLDAIVVFVDELNKFAPSGSSGSPLKSRLVDITARGRSIGLILFGAEQFASSVEREIVENSSTYLFGRTETNELRTPNYSAFSDEIKTKLTMLPQGQLLAKHAKFPQPIFLKFPYPPCVPGDKYGDPTYG